MSLNLPDHILIQSIQARNAHCDLKSIESTTQRIRKKYKLAGNMINIVPVIYPFFILTTMKESCQPCLTICIEQAAWEERDPEHLTSECSYVDIKKAESLTREEVLSKMRDGENGFHCVAKLNQAKFNELRGKLCNLPSARLITERQTTIIQCALAEADPSEMLYKKLLGL